MSTAPKACVVGWPVAHSRSPIIHRHWLAHYGIAGSYERAAVPPDGFAGFIATLGEHGYSGCNVTVPHKEMAFALAASADDMATRLKAANTLWLEDGALKAANTDAYGYLASLDEDVPGWDAASGPAVMIGAGGAARAVATAICARGLSLRIVNRTPARAETLAGDLGIDAALFGWDDMPRALEGAALLVNTTTLGMAGEKPLEVALDPLPATAIVSDIVYVPLETALLRQARARGHRVSGGLGMLLHQAAPGFARWFGTMPDVTPELRALVARDIKQV